MRIQTKYGLLELHSLGEEAVVLRPVLECAADERPMQMDSRLIEWLDDIQARLALQPSEAIRDVVRTFMTITVFYEPWAVQKGRLDFVQAGELVSRSGHRLLLNADSPYERVCGWLSRVLEDRDSGKAKEQELMPSSGVDGVNRGSSIAVTYTRVPVCFDPELGPDLEEAAAWSGLTVSTFIEQFCAAEYTVMMLGFMPGFPYLHGLPEQLAQPRKQVPRLQVAQGSVAIGGAQAGIYPLEAPGGWRLLGRTPLRLFVPERERPSLLMAGDRVRFEAIDLGTYRRLVEFVDK
ncbi:5-oxoprolinase subunit PxpB [Paenibacillus sp. YYML68]|uniref:5-oxoprolinase subunit PxpB n=1 Tax=Paenibacillus sp. YYML68 TaxID=2909250 RepID=UPI0024912326|nr:5-oxoprolinase subunit PxpB [Paenibacillus sp. YYML68]